MRGWDDVMKILARNSNQLRFESLVGWGFREEKGAPAAIDLDYGQEQRPAMDWVLNFQGFDRCRDQSVLDMVY